MGKISVVINTLNEENNIARAISSVEKLASEIIVVDMQSEDKTVEIANKLGAKVYSHKKTGYVEPARNFAIAKTTGDWILILDADEEISPQLSSYLIKLSSQSDTLLNSNETPDRNDYFRIPRKNIIFNKWIEHSRWWPDHNIRFFRKGHVVWNEMIHSVPITKGKGTDLPAIEELAIIHHNFEGLSDYFETLFRYSKIKSHELIESGYKFNKNDLFSKPVSEFFSRFFQGEGYKDGLHGLVLSTLQALGEFVIYLNVWENEKYSQERVSLKDLSKSLTNYYDDFNYWIADSELKQKWSLWGIIKRRLRLP